jgi:hypothetical protein
MKSTQVSLLSPDSGYRRHARAHETGKPESSDKSDTSLVRAR